MVALFLVGRELLGLFFLMMGFKRFRNTAGMAAMTVANGVPRPKLAVPLAAGLLLLAGFSFLTGWLPLVGVAAVTLFMIPVSLLMPAFWREETSGGQLVPMTRFLRNLSILGATRMLLFTERPWPLTLV